MVRCGVVWLFRIFAIAVFFGNAGLFLFYGFLNDEFAGKGFFEKVFIVMFLSFLFGFLVDGLGRVFSLTFFSWRLPRFSDYGTDQYRRQSII